MMASQKVASCCVALNYLVIAGYPRMPHSSKFTRLVSDDFGLATLILTFCEFIKK